VNGHESVLVTIDAAHTQRETAEYIGARPGWNYLMTVKGNQPTLQRQVFDKILPLLSGAPHHIMEEHSRGRIKKWSCWLTGADGIDFPHAAQAACIRREIFELALGRVGRRVSARPAAAASSSAMANGTRGSTVPWMIRMGQVTRRMAATLSSGTEEKSRRTSQRGADRK